MEPRVRRKKASYMNTIFLPAKDSRSSWLTVTVPPTPHHKRNHQVWDPKQQEKGECNSRKKGEKLRSVCITFLILLVAFIIVSIIIIFKKLFLKIVSLLFL